MILILFKYPGGLGLITYTHGFKWRLKVTVLTCDLFACNQCVCIKSEFLGF